MVFIALLSHPKTKSGLLGVSFAMAGGFMYKRYSVSGEDKSNASDVILYAGGDDPDQVPSHIFDNRPWNWNWDGRHGKPYGGTRTLVFVRHGQYIHAKSGLDADRVLTALGKEQAVITGKRLATLFPETTKIDKIVYSTMARATETFDIICKQLPYNVPNEPSDLIREGCVYRPIPKHPRWQPTEEEFEVDGTRIERAFQTFIRRSTGPLAEEDNGNDVTVFVCHGNVIRYIFMNALQLPKSAWLRTSVANCSITILKIHADGTVRTSLLGGTGHFPQDKISYN